MQSIRARGVAAERVVLSCGWRTRRNERVSQAGVSAANQVGKRTPSAPVLPSPHCSKSELRGKRTAQKIRRHVRGTIIEPPGPFPDSSRLMEQLVTGQRTQANSPTNWHGTQEEGSTENCPTESSPRV